MNNDLVRDLQDLHDEYAAAVNTAIAEDREQLVDQLADEFSAVALTLMLRRQSAA